MNRDDSKKNRESTPDISMTRIVSFQEEVALRLYSLRQKGGDDDLVVRTASLGRGKIKFGYDEIGQSVDIAYSVSWDAKIERYIAYQGNQVLI